MQPFHAVLLGIVQGLTEFLPISSTAHLTLTGKLLGFVTPENTQAWTAFLAVIQLGTVAAVLIYFSKDLWGMTRALFRDVRTKEKRFAEYSRESRLILFIVLGTIPVVVIGLLAKDVIEGVFTKNLIVIASSLIVLAIFLWIAERVASHSRSIEEVTLTDSLLIGLAQVLALIPGSSRSGTTITAGLFLKFDRASAARFSFLLSIPAVLGSGLYELMKIDHSVFQFGNMNLVIATIVSGISGYAAIAWLLRYLMKSTTMIFVWYRIGLGVLLFILMLTHVVTP